MDGVGFITLSPHKPIFPSWKSLPIIRAHCFAFMIGSGQEGSLRHVGSLTCTRHCVCATRHTQQTGLERAGSPWSQVREKPSARPRWQSHTGGCRAVNSICPGAKLVPLSPQHLLQTEGFLASALLTSVAASLSVVGAIHES